MRMCCFDNCDKPAEYEIFDNNDPDPYGSYTDSCTDHVGHLLGSIPPVEPIGPWSVQPIQVAVEAK